MSAQQTYFWEQVQHLRLKGNIPVKLAQKDFTNFLLNTDNNTVPLEYHGCYAGCVPLPPN